MSNTKAKKTTSAEVFPAEVVAAVEQSEQTTAELIEETAEAVSTMAETMGSAAKLVVLLFDKMQEFVKEVWRRCYEGDILFVECGESGVINEALQLIAKGDVADDFVIVSAGTLPCHSLTYEEMCVYFRRVMKDNSQVLDSHLPMRLHAERLAEVIEKGGDPSNVEEFLATYYKAAGIRPVDASFQWGNVLTPVTRGNPCHATIVESIHRKKYVVCSTPDALAGVEPAFRDWLLK